MQSWVIRVKEAKKEIANETVKVTVIGPIGAGKSYIIDKICRSKVPVTTHDIVQITFSPIYTLENQMYQFGFIELGAEEFFSKLIVELAAETKVLILVFDFTAKNLKNLCQKWCDMIQQANVGISKRLVVFNRVSL